MIALPEQFNEPNMAPPLSIGVFPGGGTQGIISVYLADQFSDMSETPFHEKFDQVAGLSVGALNAATLWPLRSTREPLMDTNELKNFYETKLDGAFKENFWALKGLLDNKYDIEGLEGLIDGIFGDLKLSDFADGLHIYVVDVEHHNLRRLSSEEARSNPSEDFYMSDLLRAAVAAPFFFEPVEIKNMAGEDVKFVDGGLFSADPSYMEYFAAEIDLEDDSNIAVTTFGTGHTNSEDLDLNDLNGGALKGGNMLASVFKSKANTFDDMLRQKLGDRYTMLNTDISYSDLGIISTDINEVVPYAQKAADENVENTEHALNTIDLILSGTFDINERLKPDIPEAFIIGQRITGSGIPLYMPDVD